MAITLGRQDLDMQLVNSDELMVAVEMITYNHEKYIAEAIESVMMQKTTFRYKLIICEDCSTDNTQQICIDYQNKYPDKIDLHLNKTNQGVSLNAKKLHDASFRSGAKYVAILDGDDYWSDELKLQRQFDFLEANKDFALCYHKVKWVFTYENTYPPNTETNVGDPTVSTVIDVLKKGWFIRSSSMFFQNTQLPPEFEKLYVGDYPLTVLLADRGKIGFIDQCMSIYRINNLGFSEQNVLVLDYKKRTDYFLNDIFLSDYLNKHTGAKYKKYFQQRKFDTIYSHLHYVFTNHRKKIISTFFFLLFRFNFLFLLSYSIKKTIKYFKDKLHPARNSVKGSK